MGRRELRSAKAMHDVAGLDDSLVIDQRRGFNSSLYTSMPIKLASRRQKGFKRLVIIGPVAALSRSWKAHGHLDTLSDEINVLNSPACTDPADLETVESLRYFCKPHDVFSRYVSENTRAGTAAAFRNGDLLSENDAAWLTAELSEQPFKWTHPCVYLILNASRVTKHQVDRADALPVS